MTRNFTRILLADDNDANRLIAHTILERSGYDVTTAKNGSQALSLAKSTKYDLIVLDIMMPVMDGMRALRRLRRENGLNQHTPVFALTAYSTAQDKQRYVLAGFDYILAKPLRPGDLGKALKHFKNGNTIPLVQVQDVKAPTAVDLIDLRMTMQISEIADQEKLETIQSRFWTSIEHQCRIIKKSLPDALRGEGQYLSHFRRAVHAVKGASAAIGLARVEYICRHLQNATPSEIPSLMTGLADALSESRPALTAALSRARQFDTSMEMRREDETETAHHNQNYRTAI